MARHAFVSLFVLAVLAGGVLAGHPGARPTGNKPATPWSGGKPGFPPGAGGKPGWGWPGGFPGGKPGWGGGKPTGFPGNKPTGKPIGPKPA